MTKIVETTEIAKNDEIVQNTMLTIKEYQDITLKMVNKYAHPNIKMMIARDSLIFDQLVEVVMMADWHFDKERKCKISTVRYTYFINFIKGLVKKHKNKKFIKKSATQHQLNMIQTKDSTDDLEYKDYRQSVVETFLNNGFTLEEIENVLDFKLKEKDFQNNTELNLKRHNTLKRMKQYRRAIENLR